jgi:hypothetical protein
MRRNEPHDFAQGAFAQGAFAQGAFAPEAAERFCDGYWRSGDLGSIDH